MPPRAGGAPPRTARKGDSPIWLAPSPPILEPLRPGPPPSRPSNTAVNETRPCTECSECRTRRTTAGPPGGGIVLRTPGGKLSGHDKKPGTNGGRLYALVPVHARWLFHRSDPAV